MNEKEKMFECRREIRAENGSRKSERTMRDIAKERQGERKRGR